MSHTREWPTLCPVRTLRKAVISGISGAAVGGMAGNPVVGAAGAAFNQVASIIGNDVPEFRLISRCGAFDLARRLNRDLRNIPRMPELLSSILTRAEQGSADPAFGSAAFPCRSRELRGSEEPQTQMRRLRYMAFAAPAGAARAEL